MDLDHIRFPLELVLDVPEGFEGLKGFLGHVEEAVERIIAEQNARANAEPYDQEEGPGVESYRATLFEETLPRTLRYSALLLMYAALDALLVKLCDTAEDTLELRFSRSDMVRQSQLEGRLDYLRKALGDALPAGAFNGPFRDKLSAFSRVRHCIAHAGGEFDVAEPKKARSTRAAAKQLGLGDRGTHLSVPAGTVRALLTEAQAWAYQVCAAVEEALPGWRVPPRDRIWEVKIADGWKAVRAESETVALAKARRLGHDPLGPVRQQRLRN